MQNNLKITFDSVSLLPWTRQRNLWQCNFINKWWGSEGKRTITISAFSEFFTMFCLTSDWFLVWFWHRYWCDDTKCSENRIKSQFEAKQNIVMCSDQAEFVSVLISLQLNKQTNRQPSCSSGGQCEVDFLVSFELLLRERSSLPSIKVWLHISVWISQWEKTSGASSSDFPKQWFLIKTSALWYWLITSWETVLITCHNVYCNKKQ